MSSGSSSGSAVSMGVITLKWSGATDDYGIAGYELLYTLGPTFTDNAWVSIPFISSTGGTGSYTHTITTFVDHKFAIRTRDTSSQYSDYKYLTVPVSAKVLISDGYQSSLGVCKQTSTNPISLSPMEPPHVNSSVKNIDGSMFNGGGLYWKISYTDGTYYSCLVNISGLITSITSCSVVDIVKSVTISSEGFSLRSDICGSGVAVATTLYYSNVLAIDNFLYSTYTGGVLSNPYDGNNQYHILVNGSTSYVVGIGTGTNIGKILSMVLYSNACPITPPSGGGGTGGGGCPDPETPINISYDIQIFAGDIKVGDFIYTIHETTGEYGEYEVTYAELIEQEKVLIIFDDNSEIKVSDTHKFLMIDGEWKQSYKLSIGDIISGFKFNKVIKSIEKIGIGLVVKFEVNDAHTYIAAGLISHNYKAAQAAV